MIRVASLDSTPQTDDEGDADVERLDSTDFCPEQLSVEDRVVLEDAMKQLRDLERLVLVHFHFDAMNQTEIAAKLGISCNYVSHILRQSLAKLRKILAGEERKDNMLRRQAASISNDVIDDMTGAYTETYFRGRLQEELHRASSEQGVVALVMIDFKGLPNLRAFYGDGSVVDFMADASEFFKSQVRRLDIVCRYGDSGFAIILPATGAGVSVVRQRLVQRVTNWISIRNGMNSAISVEIGHAAYPEDGRTALTIMKQAEPRTVPSPDAREFAA